jgi:ABC-type phosphate transport system substrate-binding protein
MHKLIFLTILTSALTLGRARSLPVSPPLQEVDIVVNTSNKIDPLTRDEVRRIFIGDKSSWAGGKHITVLMLAPDQPERAFILQELFKMNESEYTKYFLQAAFTGHVLAAPRDLPSAAQMKAQVAANPNAIGYLNRDDVNENVRVVLRLH